MTAEQAALVVLNRFLQRTSLADYYRRNRERLTASRRARYRESPDAGKASARAYYARNREVILAQKKERYARKNRRTPDGGK